MSLSQICEVTSASCLRAQKNVRFVDRTEYCKLLVCSRNLTRCDIQSARIRGVFDPELGLRYLIEEDCLFSK